MGYMSCLNVYPSGIFKHCSLEFNLAKKLLLFPQYCHTVVSVAPGWKWFLSSPRKCIQSAPGSHRQGVHEPTRGYVQQSCNSSQSTFWKIESLSRWVSLPCKLGKCEWHPAVFKITSGLLSYYDDVNFRMFRGVGNGLYKGFVSFI